MKLAFLILAHHQPLQLARLVASLPDDSLIFIHFDARAKEDAWRQANSLLEADSRVSFVKRRACFWGAYGIVAATIELIKALVAKGADYSHAFLISGVQYPIKKLESIERILAESGQQQFMEYFPIDEPNRWSDGGTGSGPARYFRYHFWANSHHGTPFKIGKRRPRGMRVYGGSQWWCLTRPCIEMIAKFVKKNGWYRRYFKHTFIPDEAFFQTIVGNSEFAPMINGDDVTYAIWGRPKPPYPAIVARDDIDHMLASGKMFARKFDLNADPDIFDIIDKKRQ